MTLVPAPVVDVDLDQIDAPAATPPALVYLASLAAGSRPAMRRSAARVVEVATGTRLEGAQAQLEAITRFRWEQLRYEHTQAIRAALAETVGPSTLNQTLSALRGVLKECWRLGLMSAESYHRAADLRSERIHRLSQATGRAASVGELRALFTTCGADIGILGRRDAGLLGVLAVTGLRRAEVVDLDLGDWHPESERLDVLAGKGHKQRSVYLNHGARRALDAWLAVRGDEPGPLFLPIRRGGHVQSGQRLTPQAVLDVLARRCAEAGIERLRPHDLRRTVASGLLDAGADVGTVSRILGHASADVTLGYDRRPEQVKRNAANLLHVPFDGR